MVRLSGTRPCLLCRLIDFFEVSYMRSAAFNSPEQFSACTLDGRRTACLGAQKCGHAFAVGGRYGYGELLFPVCFLYPSLWRLGSPQSTSHKVSCSSIWLPCDSTLHHTTWDLSKASPYVLTLLLLFPPMHPAEQKNSGGSMGTPIQNDTPTQSLSASPL
jgi:hypothetical protein